MTQIEAFDLFTESIERYVSKALTDGSRDNAIFIVAPIDPLNLQPLFSEFDLLPKESPRCNLLFERTASILNNWSAFISLEKNNESLCYRIDENYKVWRKLPATDFEGIFNGIDPYVFAWDKFSFAINEANGYLRRKIGAKTTSTKTSDKVFSAPEWAAIFYYADAAKLLPKADTKEKKIKDFISKYNISNTYNHLKNEIIEADKTINYGTFGARKLKKLLPFIKKHYSKALINIQNDIDHNEIESGE